MKRLNNSYVDVLIHSEMFVPGVGKNGRIFSQTFLLCGAHRFFFFCKEPSCQCKCSLQVGVSSFVCCERSHWCDNDNDNDTLREVPHQSNEGLALQERVSGPWLHKKNLFY